MKQLERHQIFASVAVSVKYATRVFPKSLRLHQGFPNLAPQDSGHIPHFLRALRALRSTVESRLRELRSILPVGCIMSQRTGRVPMTSIRAEGAASSSISSLASIQIRTGRVSNPVGRKIRVAGSSFSVLMKTSTHALIMPPLSMGRMMQV